MSLVAEITHTDGSTETVDATSTEEEYEFEHVDIASVFVDRPQINGITLEEDDDEVEILDGGERLFGGVLRDVLRGGGEVELVLDSYERYALDGERSAGDLAYENVADTAIYSDAIDDVPQVSAGDIDNLDNAVTFVFPYTSPAKRIRTVAESVGAEVFYGPDKTVDVVASLGSDKTESAGGTPLSPSEQNISGDFNPERQSGEKTITHLIMLGAGEGPGQIQATVVPSADPYDYEGDDKYANVRRYTADEWADGDRKKWDSRTNKDLTDPDTLGDLGVTLIEEFNGEFIDVEITVEDADVMLGDEFTVRHPGENVDVDLRAVDVTRIVDNDGRRYETTFSNRRLTRESDDEKRIKDSERYNRAFEGSAVTMNTGGGRQPVNGTLDYQFEFYYPAEVEYEHRVKLFIKGLAYRAYSQGSAAGGDHTHEFEYIVTGQHGHRITANEFDHTHGISASNVSAEDHDHPAGTTLDADNHPHDIDDSASGEPYTQRPVVDDAQSSTLFVGERSSWSDLYQVRPPNSYEMAFVWAHVTSSENVIEFRIQEYASSNYFPRSTGVAAVGSNSGHNHNNANNELDGDEYSATVLLIVPEDVGSYDVQVRTPSGTANANVQVTYMNIAPHRHSVPVNFPTQQNGASVSGNTAGDAPGVSGTSDGSEVVKTTDTEEETTTSKTTPPNQGGHQHDPDPGIIEFSEYPSNCDVVVNGTAVGVSLGDGSAPFEASVDLAGYLNPGQINRVDIPSDSLGHIQAHLDIDVYRQILGRG